LLPLKITFYLLPFALKLLQIMNQSKHLMKYAKYVARS